MDSCHEELWTDPSPAISTQTAPTCSGLLHQVGGHEGDSGRGHGGDTGDLCWHQGPHGRVQPGGRT